MAQRARRRSSVLAPKINEELWMKISEQALYRYGFRAGMINILTKDEWDHKDVASITVVQSICGDVRETFDKLDLDKNGYLDVSELGALLQGLKADTSRLPIEELMAELDDSGDGKICFDEFSVWYIQSEERILGSMRAIFEDVDVDNSGDLTASEIAVFLNLIEVDDLSDDEIREIMAKHSHSDEVVGADAVDDADPAVKEEVGDQE